MQMQSGDILVAVEMLSNEKNVEREIVLEALELGFAAATKKKLGGEVNIQVSLDNNTCDYKTYRVWTVADDDYLEELEQSFHEDRHMTVNQGVDKNLEVGQTLKEEIDNIPMGRIAIQHARQALMSHVYKASRKKMMDLYQGRVGELLSGTVKKILRDKIILDLGDGAEGVLPKEQCIHREHFRESDRVRAVLHELKEDERGSQIVLSRSCDQIARKLFEIEVPEIGDGVVEIKGIARDAGSCTKITVKTKDNRIDPVGACVGVRGARVNAVSSELCDERIDIILWDDNIAQYAVNALAPAEVASMELDEQDRSMDMYVTEDNLAQAIGRHGQNVRLASRLIGWNINVVGDAKSSEAKKQRLMNQLDISETSASALIGKSIATLEDIVGSNVSALKNIEDIDADALKAKAEEVLLVLALSGDQGDSLTFLKGIDDELADKLKKADIISINNLAEQSTDDLLDLVPDIDAKLAGDIIMQARQSWFDK